MPNNHICLMAPIFGYENMEVCILSDRCGYCMLPFIEAFDLDMFIRPELLLRERKRCVCLIFISWNRLQLIILNNQIHKLILFFFFLVKNCMRFVKHQLPKYQQYNLGEDKAELLITVIKNTTLPLTASWT